MLLVIDENVPEEVARFLRERGHQVLLLADLRLRATPDLDIARAGEDLGAVVVTMDRDFKRIVTRVPEGDRARFRRLGRLSLDCKPANARRRLEKLIRSIEFEHAEVQREGDQRLIVELTETSLRVVR